MSVGTGGREWRQYWLAVLPGIIVFGVNAWAYGVTMHPLSVVIYAALAPALVVLAVWAGVSLYHGTFWLDGTTLVQRRFRGDRRWDLTTASIRLGNVRGSLTRGKGPALFISAQEVRPVRLGLQQPGRGRIPMSPRDLLAFAEAISSGDAHDPQRHALAKQLRQRAALIRGG